MTVSTATDSLQQRFLSITGPDPYYAAIGLNALAQLDHIRGLSEEIIELSEDQIKQCIEFITISEVPVEDLKAFLVLTQHPTLDFDKALRMVWDAETIFDPNGANPKDLELEQLGAALVKANKYSRESDGVRNYGFLYLVQGIGGILYTLYGRDRFIEITRNWVKNTYSQSMLDYCRLFEHWDEVRDYPIEWAIEVLSKYRSKI